MKNKFLTLLLTGLVTITPTINAQQPAATQSSVQVTVAAKSTIKESKPVVKESKPIVKESKSKTKSCKSTYKSPQRVVSTAASLIQSDGLEQQLATFVFVVNRGEVFSINAAGELTELSLTGFTTDVLPIGSEGTMNESSCRNNIALTGAVTINAYSPEPATTVTASLRLRPLTAARGLTLSLTIDGTPQRVLLPFDSGDCRWRAGYTYRYVLTLNGGVLQVTGMTVSRTTSEKK